MRTPDRTFEDSAHRFVVDLAIRRLLFGRARLIGCIAHRVDQVGESWIIEHRVGSLDELLSRLLDGGALQSHETFDDCVHIRRAKRVVDMPICDATVRGTRTIVMRPLAPSAWPVVTVIAACRESMPLVSGSTPELSAMHPPLFSRRRCRN